MANIYKLQRYVNGNGVDVQLGQMNNVPITQTEEDDTSTLNNVATVLEQYLTLSQVQNKFLPTSVLRGDPYLQTIEQGLATAIGANSMAFGDAATIGRGAVVFGPYQPSSLDSISVPGYGHVDHPDNPEDGTETFYMKVDDLDDKVGSTISDLEKLIIRATVENTTYYLVITQVEPYGSDSYQFSFSSTQGDWRQFSTIISGLLVSSDSDLLNAQFTFIENVAHGNNSFITGQSNITLAGNSNALGQGLKTTTSNQTVVGQYNADSNAFFVVGGGQYTNKRKNILEAYDNAVKIYQPVTVNGPITYKPELFGGGLNVYGEYNTSTKGGTPRDSLPTGHYLVRVQYDNDDRNELFNITGGCTINNEMSSFSIDFFKYYNGYNDYAYSHLDHFYGVRPPRSTEWFFYESKKEISNGLTNTTTGKQLSSNDEFDYVISFIRLY